eukprot:CAMPEP_0195649406 /NCGR_PEP_ID=MMETSP0815-20121206/31171_1 /TAXON_ID=97485 /ORGANISM="Prymnesium parvum, Strain Texoma1" /LENGTH=190 /DNA_ID=CAMNT_0040793151 /DNA_START=62 /DNA_END=634 /DNA_ORIENTATION=-
MTTPNASLAQDQKPPEQPKRPVKDPARYKTVMCNKFEKLGKCPYGPRCQFAHGFNDLRKTVSTASSSSTSPLYSRSATSTQSYGMQQQGRESNATSDNDTTLSGSCDEDLSELMLHGITGQVLCHRDASHHTQSLRRTISFLFSDDEQNSTGSPARTPTGALMRLQLNSRPSSAVCPPPGWYASPREGNI